MKITTTKNTELCEIAYKYGTDKCPAVKHSYTPFYYQLLKDKRQSVKKVLELGIGRLGTMRGRYNQHYRIGASLYMWRDFFSSALVYGADIKPEVMFKDERIETFLCDAGKKEDLIKLIKKTGTDIDLFIDDGSHLKEHQILTCLTCMPLFKNDVIYIIEDVKYPEEVVIGLREYNCEILEFSKKYNDDNLIIVRKKI